MDLPEERHELRSMVENDEHGCFVVEYRSWFFIFVRIRCYHSIPLSNSRTHYLENQKTLGRVYKGDLS